MFQSCPFNVYLFEASTMGLPDLIAWDVAGLGGLGQQLDDNMTSHLNGVISDVIADQNCADNETCAVLGMNDTGCITKSGNPFIMPW